MKYKSNKYYQQITMAQFDELVFDEYLDPLDSILEFDELESKEINKYVALKFSNYNVSMMFKSRSFLSDKYPGPRQIRHEDFQGITNAGRDEIVQLSINISPYKDEFGPIRIYKLPDEWYVASILGYGQFKCDQLEGLYRLIDDYREEYEKEEGINLDTNKLRVVDMKYLKLYEDFDFVSNYESTMNKLKNLSNDNYYQKISVSDSLTLSNDLDSMNDTTYTTLLNKLKSLDYYNINITDSKTYLSARSDWLNIHIYSCSDEWFIVLALEYNYKCDQLSGVIKLIDDIQNCIDN
jgi:hypothetical protein